ncbi:MULTISPECIES: O-methyltransferase [Streptomyces]|uniref:O-methyltransferase n=1 Tax=Streptomyces xinghaiensis TaxID=1038928 RepID=A0A3R7J940_9ACTN|nr:SAM-dependent methyltransferase [Streptomyces xinghaiensis]RKM98953.1 O-methyltransferase [Streptomyces xinghaiensis]RNC76145.1 O-methyltransferase [Streptomyces xinghaiensis]
MADTNTTTGAAREAGKRSPLDPDQVTPLTPELYDYVLRHNPQLDRVRRELVDTTYEKLGGRARMQVSEEQGPLLAFLAKLVGARLIVEVGTFTGMSALWMAEALPDGGKVITCDVSEEWTAYGREAWEKAGVADRIDLRIGPALDTLRALPADPVIDLSFIDADKENNGRYWEELVPRTRPGGMIVVDNVFFHGEVTDPEATGGGGATRDFNEQVLADDRVESVMLTVADGLTLARKR